MRYFAGLDVSLEETAICVVDENGVIVKEVRATSEPEALIVALREVGLPLERRQTQCSGYRILGKLSSRPAHASSVLALVQS